MLVMFFFSIICFRYEGQDFQSHVLQKGYYNSVGRVENNYSFLFFLFGYKIITKTLQSYGKKG